jgi:osmotically-inducible protein OsmY
VRRAIRADPFLAVATRAVRVSSNRGIVRLRGQVRTHKERSSMVFKAGQIVGIAGVEDRVTVGNRVERAVW